MFLNDRLEWRPQSRFQKLIQKRRERQRHPCYLASDRYLMRYGCCGFHRTFPNDNASKLTLLIAILYVFDMFGVFPFVTLPAVLVQLGFFGIPLIISVMVLQIYTSFLLSECWAMAQKYDSFESEGCRYPYAAIANLAYGPCAGVLVTILLNVSIFANGIPNIVMAAQNLELVGNRISNGQFQFPFYYWAIIVGLFLCPMAWLGSPKKMRRLVIFSAAVMIVIVFLLCFCLFATHPVAPPFQGITFDLPPFLKVLSGYSLLAFQFDIHPMLLTLQMDMREKSKVGWAAFCGITATSTMAILVSVLAAYKFGSMVAENVLESLPRSVMLYILLILVAIQLCFSVAVGSSALFLQIENCFKISEDISRQKNNKTLVFSPKRVLIRSTVVGLQVMISEFLPSFDALMNIVGGTITGPLVFILPPLLYRRMVQLELYYQRHATTTYGSIALDMNYVPFHEEPPELEPCARVTMGALLKLCWLRTIYIFSRFQCDLYCSLAILLFGILATFLATYLNLFELNGLFRNNSPCFNNFNTTK